MAWLTNSLTAFHSAALQHKKVAIIYLFGRIQSNCHHPHIFRYEKIEYSLTIPLPHFGKIGQTGQTAMKSGLYL